MRPHTGTLEWACLTGGRLSFRDKLQLIADAIPLFGHFPLDGIWRLKRRLRRGPRTPSLTLEGIRFPDTVAARQAEAGCSDPRVYPPFLFHHCQRTYLWARILADRWKVASEVDSELLYVACLLHDLGLTERYA